MSNEQLFGSGLYKDGRADHDPQASAERVAEALSAALAAEAGHAETLSADRSDV